MPVRSGSAVWEGDLKGGKGRLKSGANNFEGSYTFASRFEEGSGTNPEEFIATAHAACFTMALSNMLAQAGFTPKKVETTAKVHLQFGPGGAAIGPIELTNSSHVPGIDDAKFQEIALAAKNGCPVSKALAAVEIKLSAKLA